MFFIINQFLFCLFTTSIILHYINDSVNTFLKLF
ncbi:hypothetical protein [Staphylococcus phage vB_SauM-V1SA20]|nr:hypothetical protein [Staphylococcus phage vB_SauM-V1SA20]